MWLFSLRARGPTCSADYSASEPSRGGPSEGRGRALHPQPCPVPERVAVRLLHRRPDRGADVSEEVPGADVGGELSQVRVVPRRLDALEHARGGSGVVPADPEAVAVRRLRPELRMQALVDQRMGGGVQRLAEQDRRTRVGKPATHLQPSAFSRDRPLPSPKRDDGHARGTSSRTRARPGGEPGVHAADLRPPDRHRSRRRRISRRGRGQRLGNSRSGNSRKRRPAGDRENRGVAQKSPTAASSRKPRE